MSSSTRSMRLPPGPQAVAGSSAFHSTSKPWNASRYFSTSAARYSDDKKPDPGGKPLPPDARTVYDDFSNILEPRDGPGSAGAGGQTPLSIASMSDTAFTLTDGLVLSQPIIFLNGELFLWNPPDLDKAKAAPNGQGWEEWLAEEGGRDAIWKLFEIVTPKPEIILFGTGRTVLPPPPQIKAYLGGLGIQLEVQNSRNAGSTYNMLLEEGRRVAAALLPPERPPQ